MVSLAKTAWRTLLGKLGVYGLASGKAASPLRFAAAVQIAVRPATRKVSTGQLQTSNFGFQVERLAHGTV